MDKYNVIFPPLRHTALGRAMLALLISLVCTLLWGTTRISPVYAETKPATGVVYVESNIPTLGGNSILAYRRSDAGDLTPLPGSPFPTGGAGVGDPDFTTGPFDSDQNIVINPEGTRLFAVNSGSNSIAVFDILEDGRKDRRRPVGRSDYRFIRPSPSCTLASPPLTSWVSTPTMTTGRSPSCRPYPTRAGQSAGSP